MNRGAQWATIHGVAKSRTQLSDFHFRWPLPSRSQVVMAKKNVSRYLQISQKGVRRYKLPQVGNHGLIVSALAKITSDFHGTKSSGYF